MENWTPAYNWTHEEFLKVINASNSSEKHIVTLDVEHSDARNEQQIIKWADELGYDAEIQHHNETIKIMRRS